MSQPPQDPGSTAAVMGKLFAGLVAIVLSPLPLLLLFVAQTYRGRFFACAALALAIWPMVAVLAWQRKQNKWRIVTAALGSLFIGATIWLIMTAPTGKAISSAKAQHSYVAKQPLFNRYALGNLLPEVDQLNLGFTLMPAVDPLLTQPQASRLKQWTSAVYAELEQDHDFRSLGSVLPLAYAELRGEQPAILHSFVYVPANLDRTKPAPVIVFFHGSGGNFKGYLWVLSKVADRLGCVLVAPSFGLGNWQLPETGRLFDSALVAASNTVNINRDEVHVVGLSNGGLAVSQVFATAASHLKSLVFISPVFDVQEIKGMTDNSSVRQKPVFILTGQIDDRIPLDYVEENVARLRRTRASIELKVVDGADHFLIFSHRDLVIDTLVKWVSNATRPN